MELYKIAAQTGADTGDWYAIHDTRANGVRQISITLTGTSATIEIYGKVSGDDAEQLIWTGTASEGISAVCFPYMRVKLSAATAATVLVTIDGNGRVGA